MPSRSRDSDGLRAGWPGVRFPAGARDFSLLHSVQTGSGVHAISPRLERLGREADHSPPSSAEVKNGGAIPPLPHMSSWYMLN
jgi:hypothetical protein